ncbi:MAG: hypothetical protein ACKO1F_13865 [Flammeovirgaceae bacterium]
MKCTLLLLILIPLASARSQEAGYQSGFIVTNQNDTIKGLIKNKNSVPYRILVDIKFKKNKDSEVEKFGPRQLKGFQIGSTKYKSLITDANGISETLFLEVVDEGKLNYYELEYTGLGAGNVTNYVILQLSNRKEQLIYSKNDMLFSLKKK